MVLQVCAGTSFKVSWTSTAASGSSKKLILKLGGFKEISHVHDCLCLVCFSVVFFYCPFAVDVPNVKACLKAVNGHDSYQMCVW